MHLHLQGGKARKTFSASQTFEPRTQNIRATCTELSGHKVSSRKQEVLCTSFRIAGPSEQRRLPRQAVSMGSCRRRRQNGGGPLYLVSFGKIIGHLSLTNLAKVEFRSIIEVCQPQMHQSYLIPWRHPDGRVVLNRYQDDMCLVTIKRLRVHQQLVPATFGTDTYLINGGRCQSRMHLVTLSGPEGPIGSPEWISPCRRDSR